MKLLMKIYLSILLLFPTSLVAQMPFEKAIKKLGLSEERVIYTTEKVKAYPRNLIYDVENPDSVFYFGCISTDQKEFDAYFDNPATANKLPVGHPLRRDLGSDVDTIMLEPLSEKTKYLSYKDSSKTFKLTEGVRFFVICYWSTETIDRHIIKNYRKFFWTIEKSEYEARVIFVCTDEK